MQRIMLNGLQISCSYCGALLAAVHEEATKRHVKEGKIKQYREKAWNCLCGHMRATHSDLFDNYKDEIEVWVLHCTCGVKKIACLSKHNYNPFLGHFILPSIHYLQRQYNAAVETNNS